MSGEADKGKGALFSFFNSLYLRVLCGEIFYTMVTMRLSLLIVVAIAGLAAGQGAASRPAKEFAGTVAIRSVWAYRIDGTRALSVEKKDGQYVSPDGKLTDEIAAALAKSSIARTAWSAAATRPAYQAFAVAGQESEALRNAHAVLVEGRAAPALLPAGGKNSLVFYVHGTSLRVELDDIKIEGGAVTVIYKLHPGEERKADASFALIPLPDLPPGRYKVDFVGKVAPDAKAIRSLDLDMFAKNYASRPFVLAVGGAAEASEVVEMNGLAFQVVADTVWAVPPAGKETPVAITMRVTNRTDKDIDLPLMDTVTVRLTDAAGKSPDYTAGRDETTPVPPIVVPAGKSVDVPYPARLGWAEKGPGMYVGGHDGSGMVWRFSGLRPGKYSVSLRYESNPPQGSKLWRGSLSTKGVAAEITAGAARGIEPTVAMKYTGPGSEGIRQEFRLLPDGSFIWKNIIKDGITTRPEELSGKLPDETIKALLQDLGSAGAGEKAADAGEVTFTWIDADGQARSRTYLSPVKPPCGNLLTAIESLARKYGKAAS